MNYERVVFYRLVFNRALLPSLGNSEWLRRYGSGDFDDLSIVLTILDLSR